MTMVMSIVILLCALFASTVLSHDHEGHIFHNHDHHRLLSQEPHGCGFQAPDKATIERLAIAQEERVARIEQERAITSQALFRCNPARSDTQVVHIDTYIHAIEMTNGTGFLSDAVLEQSVESANKHLLSTGFQLNLISMNRVTSDIWYISKWNSEEQKAMESQYKEGGPNILNIYYKAAILGSERYCGYANLAEDAISAGTQDGIVMDSNCATADAVLAHEVGHWMNLLHTFDGGCSPGDLVDDTNAQASYYTGSGYDCPDPLPDTCPDQPGRDPLDNIMDYAPSECVDRFTRGQARRMQEAWRNIRDA